MSIKSKLLTSILLFFSFQQVHAQGFDLTPAVLGCIMSGGDCLNKENICISFIADFFSRENSMPAHTDESLCYAYLGNWCSGPAGQWSAHTNCRESKKQFYKHTKQKLNDWNPPKGQMPGTWREWTEEAYFMQLEKDLSPVNGPFFTCNARQQYQWLKAKCGRTRVYQKVWSKDWTTEEWKRMPTDWCREDY